MVLRFLEIVFLESFHATNFVGLHRGDCNVEDPEEDEAARGDGLPEFGSTKFPTDGRMPPQEKDENGEESFNAENGDGEAETADWDLEYACFAASALVVDGGHTPSDTDTEEDVDGVGASNVAHRGVSGFILDSCGLGGKGIGDRSSKCDKSDGIDGVLEVDEASEMTSDVTDDSRAETNHEDRDDECWVAFVDGSWWDQSKEEFERECQEVHDVVGH